MTRIAPRPGVHWRQFLGLAALVLVADQLTKAWLVSVLPRAGDAMQVVGDTVRLVHSQNSGALFGLFRDSAVLFGLASIVVVAGIVWYHGRAGTNRWLSLALGLLLGGALGNMTDRLRIGYVVDWVDLGIGDLRWYTFNVADMAVSGAILLLILSALLPGRFGLDGDDRPDARDGVAPAGSPEPATDRGAADA